MREADAEWSSSKGRYRQDWKASCIYVPSPREFRVRLRNRRGLYRARVRLSNLLGLSRAKQRGVKGPRGGFDNGLPRAAQRPAQNQRGYRPEQQYGQCDPCALQ